RQRTGVRRPHVQEVNRLAVDRGRELRDLVESGLRGPPVEGCPPVLGEAPHVRTWHAPLPAGAGQVVWPAGPGEPVVKVVDVALRDLDAEGPDVIVDGVHTARMAPNQEEIVPHFVGTWCTCWKPRPGSCACCRSCRAGATGRVPSSRHAWE